MLPKMPGAFGINYFHRRMNTKHFTVCRLRHRFIADTAAGV
ncbi:hypothetical protein [Methylomonas albis]|nr:hypothetical protein [Methylomonas albis]